MLPVFSKSCQAICAAPFSSRLSRIRFPPMGTVCGEKRRFIQVKFFAALKVKLQPAVAVKFAYRQVVAIINISRNFLPMVKTSLSHREKFTDVINFTVVIPQLHFRERTKQSINTCAKTLSLPPSSAWLRPTSGWLLFILFVAVLFEQLRLISPVFLHLHVGGQKDLRT